MSKSRLEKFLYALYSLDSSDLPNPLSRIEELYKCLVTGEEAPTFEPLSRVEKYLMAILGVYDVDSLPNPLSRVEVLLYKLATGDDNLDDFKSFLSEHEKLLAEIIRNGGAGGNIDIEYVLYTLSTEFNTLYNTAEKPVKSAILKGNTIVSHYSSNIVELTANGSWIENPVSLTQITLPVKPSTDYLFIVEIIENSLIGDETINNSLRFGETEGTERFPSVFKSISAIPLHQLGMYRFILTTKADISNIDIFDRKQLSKHCTGGKIKFRYVVIEYQQGMENWDIPYFEGMQSVKMPVLTTSNEDGTKTNILSMEKKLFDGILTPDYLADSTGQPSGLNSSLAHSCYTPSYIPIQANEKFRLRVTSDGSTTVGDGRVYFYDKDYNYLKIYVTSLPVYTNTFSMDVINTVPNNSNIAYMRVRFFNGLGVQADSVQINKVYELRGIGDVKDELDLMTGGVTRRITEVVFDGSENWSITYHNVTNRKRYSLNNVTFPFANYREISDSFATGKSFWNLDETGMYIGTNGKLLIAFQTTDNRYNYTIDEFKKYLSENPVKLQYIIEEFLESTSITAKDQDGNDTELSTFNDITHITLSSEGLIPEAELEVATKNEEVINTMSLEMDDISTTQNDLQETSNTQSENVDATMVATTEIYEGLL